jgi:hypothetical protein
LTTDRFRKRTWLAFSLHQWNVAAGEIGITMTCVMSSAAEMRKVGLRIDVKSTSALIRSHVKRGTMIIMVPIMTNLTNNALPWEDTMQEKSKPFPTI